MSFLVILTLFLLESQSYCDSDRKHDICQQSSLRSTQAHERDRAFSSCGGWSSEPEAGGSRSPHFHCSPAIVLAGGQKYNVSCTGYDITSLSSRCRARAKEPETGCGETKAGTGGASGRPVVVEDTCDILRNSASLAL